MITAICDPAVSAYALVPMTNEFKPDDRTRFEHVKCLPLGETLNDVDEHDIGVIALGDALGQRRAHVASADHRYLGSHGSRFYAAPARRGRISTAGGIVGGSGEGSPR